ncbi:hypothetical protein [Brevibacillus gelatini]|nr:hypothetical protein [Brevibacillus gelatini]
MSKFRTVSAFIVTALLLTSSTQALHAKDSKSVEILNSSSFDFFKTGY